ncbi:hypothetical protein AMTRI_Chr01g137340 [Amborella trichopoda]
MLVDRHKCSACFKLYNKHEHLVAHMKDSYHSVHEPMCGVCKKHCKTFESLREHLLGPLRKSGCALVFLDRGCHLCLSILSSSDARSKHLETCQMLPANPHPIRDKAYFGLYSVTCEIRGREAVAIDCEMVGGGDDGSLNLCARVCLIDEDENMIFHSYVKPPIPVTDYRFEITGIKEEHLKDAMPVNQLRHEIEEILFNGESSGRVWLDGGKARVLVGHSLHYDIVSLDMDYPSHLRRDSAEYLPFMKTNKSSHSLKYLTKTYLGYEIQSGVHDPYEDCVAVMRLYKRMRSQPHKAEECTTYNPFLGFTQKELESMTSDELLDISRTDYYCWCLDAVRKVSE